VKTPAMPAHIKKALHAEGLDRGEFDWDIARPQVFDPLAYAHDTPEEAANEFLEQHPWPNTAAGKMDRQIWALHAARRSNRSIAGEVGLDRKKVNAVVNRLKKLAEGRLTRERRPGRKRDEEGRGAGCLQVLVRLNEAEEGALLYAVDKLRARGELPPAKDPTGRKAIKRIGPQVLRAALAAFARRL
jgi:hypothetical protein